MACISSGIIKVISDKNYTSQIWQIFLKSTIGFMKIIHEICHSPENGFINSRTALKNLLKLVGEDVFDLKIDLHLTNYRELTNFPLYYTSLSHTKDLGAAVLALKTEVRGIGIDIEWSTRIIKPGAEKFFVNQADNHSLSPIETWTAKEAAFKALSPLNSYPGTLVLSKIIIQNSNFFTLEQPEIIGSFVTTHQQGYVLTIATISL